MGPRCSTLLRRVLVIFGAGTPAASALAARAATKGAHLVLVDADAPALNQVADRLRRQGATVITLNRTSAELGDVGGEARRAFGAVHAWINVGDACVRDGVDVALSCLRDDGGTLVNLGAKSARPGVRARRVVRERGWRINVCAVHAPPHRSVEAIAHSTLACLRHPRREVTVGPATVVMSVLDQWLPARARSPGRRSSFRRTTVPDREVLRRVTRGQREPIRSNLYAAVVRHPWTTLALTGAATLFFGSAPAHAPTIKRSRVNT